MTEITIYKSDEFIHKVYRHIIRTSYLTCGKGSIVGYVLANILYKSWDTSNYTKILQALDVHQYFDFRVRQSSNVRRS